MFTRQNARKTTLGSIVAIAALLCAGCSDDDPTHAAQGTDAYNAAYHTENGHMQDFETVFETLKEDLTEKYHIVSADIPELLEARDTYKYDKLQEQETFITERWLDSLNTERLDPAKIRVLTDGNERYMYEVALVNGDPVLFPLQDSETSADDAPLPDTFLREEPS